MRYKSINCSECNKPKIKIGLKFRAPAKYKIKEWKTLENKYNNEENYFHYADTVSSINIDDDLPR